MTDDGWRGHSTNLVGIPTALLASAVFNEHPLPLHIAGARETNPRLFEMLAQATSAAEAADGFEKYMQALFQEGASGASLHRAPRLGPIGEGASGASLHRAPRLGPIGEGAEPVRGGNGMRRYRTSYRELLEGWGFDANGPAGAVLKGWVESRFGLTPVFHKAPIRRIGAAPWVAYVEEKMGSRYHNNSINLQLDLLYEFCQWALAHLGHPPRRRLTLYRGVNDLAEHEILARPDRHHAVLRLNSLVSFSAERAIAGQFGDVILETQVPAAKILFFRELLPTHPLTGEAEYLVIGGEYRVQLSYL
jgi:NAD+--dinitrogen-reductase ADP-D-ribosyltransferase